MRGMFSPDVCGKPQIAPAGVHTEQCWQHHVSFCKTSEFKRIYIYTYSICSLVRLNVTFLLDEVVNKQLPVGLTDAGATAKLCYSNSYFYPAVAQISGR